MPIFGIQRITLHVLLPTCEHDSSLVIMLMVLPNFLQSHVRSSDDDAMHV